jgi:hypothetical protein
MTKILDDQPMTLPLLDVTGAIGSVCLKARTRCDDILTVARKFTTDNNQASDMP